MVYTVHMYTACCLHLQYTCTLPVACTSRFSTGFPSLETVTRPQVDIAVLQAHIGAWDSFLFNDSRSKHYHLNLTKKSAYKSAAAMARRVCTYCTHTWLGAVRLLAFHTCWQLLNSRHSQNTFCLHQQEV